MQVQLVVANEHNKGQVIPINVPSFMIGRAEGCNLRSRSLQVSRFHCTITVSNGAVMVQDLGGENGTFVNGNRVASVLQLKDGDKLAVGTHSFVVAIKTGAEKPATNQDNNFFELTPLTTSRPVKSDQNDQTRPVNPGMETTVMQSAKKTAQEAEVMFEIRLDGQRVSVTKSRLFDLARRGSVLPDDLVVVAGTKVFADSIQGIVFGDKSSAPPPPPRPASPTGSAVRPPAAPAAPSSAAADTDPFVFPDLGDTTAEANPFDDVVAEPLVRAARKESAFRALWSALDISFSRVYTIEGNDLVIHSIKALYYVLVVICFLAVFWIVVDLCAAWYKSGQLLEELKLHYIALATSMFGGVTIIVIVRVLLEMLLLAWIESAHAEQETEEKDGNEKK